jgi:hypothetical protein
VVETHGPADERRRFPAPAVAEDLGLTSWATHAMSSLGRQDQIGGFVPRVAGAALLVGAVLACLACGDSEPVPARFWTESQAESIRLVRGTPLKTTNCTGLGEERVSAYRRFRCVGVHWPKGLGYPLPVRVRYVLNTRGKYRGQRSPYLATSVYFDSFGVP